MRSIHIAYTAVVQERGAPSCLAIRSSFAISSVPFFFFALVYRLTRDRSIEMALGYGRLAVVADAWCDWPRQRDVPRTAHT